MKKTIKNILITGASGDIGSAICLSLAEFPGPLALGLHYFKEGKDITRLQEKIRRKNTSMKTIPLRADLLLESERHSLIHRFLRQTGSIDALVNCAGAVYGRRDFLHLTKTDWDKTFALNVSAPFFLAQQAFPYMKKTGGGKIISISSIASQYGGGSSSIHYAGAKAALEAVMRGLARYGAKDHILINTVRAGFILTQFHKKMGRGEADIKKRIALIPLGRPGRPEDVASMVAYLLSEKGDFITKETITVAGGD